MKKKTRQQIKCGKKRREILAEIRNAVSKTPMQKLKKLFGISE
jgi:hypothetical protein